MSAVPAPAPAAPPRAGRRRLLPPGTYVAAVVGWVVCALLSVAVALPAYSADAGLSILVIYVPLLTLVCATYGLPVTVATVLVTGPLGRWRAVRALATGVVAGVLASLWLALTLPTELHPVEGSWDAVGSPWAAVVVGVSALVGRVVADVVVARTTRPRR